MRLRVFILMGLTILLVGLSYVVLRALNMQLVNIEPANFSNIGYSQSEDEETIAKELLSEPPLPILPSKSPSQSAPGSNDNDIEQDVFQPPKPPSPNWIPSTSENNDEIIVDKIPDVVISSESVEEIPRLLLAGEVQKPVRRPINAPPKPQIPPRKAIFTRVGSVSKSKNNDNVISETNRITDDVESRKPGVQLSGESPSDVVGKLNPQREESKLAPPIPERKSYVPNIEPANPVAKPDLTN